MGWGPIRTWTPYQGTRNPVSHTRGRVIVTNRSNPGSYGNLRGTLWVDKKEFKKGFVLPKMFWLWSYPAYPGTSSLYDGVKIVRLVFLRESQNFATLREKKSDRCHFFFQILIFHEIGNFETREKKPKLGTIRNLYQDNFPNFALTSFPIL